MNPEPEERLPALDEGASARAAAAALAAPRTGEKVGGLREWFWRRAACDAAAAEVRSADSQRMGQLGELIEIADRLATRVEAPSAGSGLGAAIVLYREALLVATATARAEGETEVDYIAACTAGSGMRPDRARGVAAALLARTTPDVARLSEKEQMSEVAAARELLHAVLDCLDGPRRAHSRVLAQRFVRMTTLAVVVSALVVWGAMAVRDRNAPPDLLQGKPWRASSAYPGLNLKEHVCDGQKTRVFFHTNHERDPFVQFDLGAPRQIRHFEIVNRRDCCDERAIPLVGEVSTDGKTFHQIFRQRKPFATLEKDIPPVTARYIRLTTKAMTWLHLERVSAH